MHYQHILLAVDLSSQSEIVATRAQSIAQQNNATLEIVHVIEQSPLAYGGEFSIPIDVNLAPTIEAQARAALDILAETVNIPLVKRHLLTGLVKHSVISLAEKLKTDLIIIGSHGHHGIDRLLGSQANAILHKAPCDVLAVRIKDVRE